MAYIGSSNGNKPDTQHSTVFNDIQQTIDIWVRTRAVLCICSVFGKNGEAMGCGLSINSTEVLVKILINNE